MKDYFALNSSKVAKVVYLLLKQYHRLQGLGVIGWFKQPGNLYYSFFSMAVRHPDKRGKFLFGSSHPYCLTIYQQGLGIPAWGSKDGRQIAHPDVENRELSSEEMLKWYEDQLSLTQFFRDHTEPISLWRDSYHVSQSERYLLTWKVLGLLASITWREIICPGCTEHGVSQAELELMNLRNLGLVNPEETVQYCGGLTFSTAGYVQLPSGQRVDFWQQYLDGASAEMIADELAPNVKES